MAGAIASGAAFAKFRAFVTAQGGDSHLVDDPARLPAAPVKLPVAASETATVAALDAREVGLVTVEWGADGTRRAIQSTRPWG